MADATTTGFDFSPNTITAQDYQAIKAEREEMLRKQDAANNEFMYQHYKRLLRVLDESYERATKANVVLEKKERREKEKQRRQQLQAAKARP